MIGVNFVPPIPPRLDIEKVPPCISSIFNFLSLAFEESLPSSSAISRTSFFSASFTTGTTNPSGVSHAKPIL